MEKGEYIGSWEKYGYVKSPENKNQLIVNPETAPVVRMIYQWRSEGMSYMGINKKLNDMGIPSPGQYKADRGKMCIRDRCYPWYAGRQQHIRNIVIASCRFRYGAFFLPSSRHLHEREPEISSGSFFVPSRRKRYVF